MKADSNKSNAKKELDKQRKSIETLKKLLTYYQEITDTIREPFIILDKDLIVVTANHAFYQMFKVPKIKTEGMLIYELGNNQWDAPQLRELLEKILPEHKKFNDFEVVHNFPELGHRTMLLNARQIDSKQLILLAIEDITKSKILQENTEELNADLIKQQRELQALSDSKDEFIHLASHQLRTPATVVKQYTEMLREGYAGELSEDQIVMIDKAISSNERQLEIIENLLKVARADAGIIYLAKSNCDVGQLIDDVIEEQLVTFNNREQNVVFDKSTTQINAYMDERLMHMVFENLLDNAGKYSNDSKTITIGLKQNKKHTAITIKDAGVGILKKDQNKLFKKFSRIDNPLSLSTVGTGLGLYWVKKIVDLHEGTIGISSEIGQGSVFTVKIPTLTNDTTPRKVAII
ncbi:MAG: PAS domain-containing sensor histidine kinase [bacterium]|nr:PAS domain-containing sensor histidine kinase [bacterium]